MEKSYPAIGNITRIEYGGQPVIPTARLAEFYETSAENLRVNFFNAQKKARFVEGKYFFKVEGAALDTLRNENFDMQISEKTRVLYLWTKRGCARQNAIKNVELGIRNGYAAVIPNSYLLTPNYFARARYQSANATDAL